MPAWLLPAALTAANIGGNMLTQRWANRANQRMAADQRRWNEQQWYRESQFSQQMQDRQNEFNLDMWNRANVYNSPASQMQRFKDAGLNPNLIYSKGTAGQAGGLTSAPITTPNTKPYQRAQNVAPKVNLLEYMNARSLQAQTNNVDANTLVQEQKARTEATNQVLNIVKAAGGKLDNKLKAEILDYQIQAAEQNLRNITNEANKSALEVNELELTIPKRLKKLDAEIAGILENTTAKNLENQLNKALKPYGLTTSDNVIMRILFKNIGKAKNLTKQDIIEFMIKNKLSPPHKF